MRRNPLLYSDSQENSAYQETRGNSNSFVTEVREQEPRTSSFLFYLIILANSLLVLFVLGFIWFLFLKSPDLQIKEFSNRFFGTNLKITEPQQTTFAAPEIKTEVIITPTQQEKDETQQAKLKQMREKEELAAEKKRIEAMKAEIELEKARAKEAQQLISDLHKNETVPVEPAVVDESDQPVEIEQKIVTNDTVENPEINNSTQSQVDLIMETLKLQQNNNSN